MGSASSVAGDTLSAEQVQKLTGERFDRAEFDRLSNEGVLSKDAYEQIRRGVGGWFGAWVFQENRRHFGAAGNEVQKQHSQDLVEVAAFLIYFTYLVVKLPSMSREDPMYFRSLKYMVYRFQPSAWYWGPCFLLRNLLVAFATVVDPSQPFIQMMFLGCILTVYTCSVRLKKQMQNVSFLWKFGVAAAMKPVFCGNVAW